MPIETLAPTLGKKCGRRERAGRRDAGAAVFRSSRSIAYATVKGIPTFGTPALFAELRKNEGLGRSVTHASGSSRAGGRADDSGCPKGAEEGNVSACARSVCTCASAIVPCSGDASFARSFGPCTSNPTALRGASLGGGAFGSASRLGKLARARRTSTGVVTSGRSAARRVSPLPRGRRRGTSEKEGGHGLRPCEVRELGFGCPHVVCSLQKSTGDVGSRIRSVNALQKERSEPSEQGSSSQHAPATPARASGERTLAGRPHR